MRQNGRRSAKLNSQVEFQSCISKRKSAFLKFAPSYTYAPGGWWNMAVMFRVRRNLSCCLRPITLGPWPYYRVSDLWSGPYLDEFSLNKRHLHHGCPTPPNACCRRCHQGERFPTHPNPGRSEQSTCIWAPRLWCWIWSDGIVWVSFANHGLGSLEIDMLAARLRWVLQTGPSYL